MSIYIYYTHTYIYVCVYGAMTLLIEGGPLYICVCLRRNDIIDRRRPLKHYIYIYRVTDDQIEYGKLFGMHIDIEYLPSTKNKKLNCADKIFPHITMQGSCFPLCTRRSASASASSSAAAPPPLILLQLILLHSSHTTHLTPLILHHSSYTTLLTPLILHHSS